MKNAKRILSLILTALIISSCAALAYGESFPIVYFYIGEDRVKTVDVENFGPIEYIDESDPAIPDYYTILGWYRDPELTEDSKWNFETDTVNDFDVDLYAKYVGPCTVSVYNSPDATEPSCSWKYKKGSLINDSERYCQIILTSEDYDYPAAKGWYTSPDLTEDTRWNFAADRISDDISLYPEIVGGYRVDFTASISEGGDVIENSETNICVPAGSVLVDYLPDYPLPELNNEQGYIFNGYYLEDEYWDLETDTVDEDMTLEAQYLAPHSVTFEYNCEYTLNEYNSTTGEYEAQTVTGRTIGVGEGLLDPKYLDNPREGYGFAGWYKDEGLTQIWDFDADTVTGDVTLYAKWTEDEYNVYFCSDNPGNTITRKLKPIKFTKDTLEEIKLPSVIDGDDGVIIESWAIRNPKFPNDRPIRDEEVLDIIRDLGKNDRLTDLTLRPVRARGYTVSFDANGHGNNPDDVRVRLGRALVLPVLDPVDGFSFEGWYKEKECNNKWTDSDIVTENITLYAKWAENEKYKLTVDYDNGEDPEVTEIPAGAAIPAIADPVKRGYTFAGWDPDMPETMPANDLTVTALWIENEKYTLTVDFDNDEESAVYELEAGAAIPAIADPEKAGFTFAGWEDDMPETMPAHNLTITAIWIENEKYKLTVDFDNGEEPKVTEIAAGAAIPAIADPERGGYKFAGWDPEMPGTMPANDLTVKATWVKVYTLTIDPANGDNKVVRYYEADEPVSETDNPSTFLPNGNDPTRFGCTFAGWSQKLPPQMPANNVTISAKWSYIEGTLIPVRLSNSDYVEDETIYVEIGSKADNLPVYEAVKKYTGLIAKYYLPEGWYTDSGFRTKFNPDTIIDAPTVLYSKWVEACTVTVKYNSSSYEDKTVYVAKGTALNTILDTPQDTDKFDFIGWYSDSNFKTPVDPDTVINSGLTVYAKWGSKNTIVDTATGIMVDFGNNEVPENLELLVKELDKTQALKDKAECYLLITSFLNGQAYDISLLLDGKEYQPDTPVKIMIPIPESLKNSVLSVIHFTDSGSFDTISVNLEEYDGVDYAVFTVNHFSTFILGKTSDIPEVSVKVAAEKKVYNKSKVKITAEATGAPEGTYVAIYVDGKQVAKGDNKSVTYDAGKIIDDINYTVAIVDKNDNVQKSADGKDLAKDGKVSVKKGFFDKIIAFFLSLFGLLKEEIKP